MSNEIPTRSATSKRNANIEILRCFLMFLIVLGHCSCHGAYGKTTTGLVLGVMTAFAVDAFAFISGWFSIKSTPQRMLRFCGLGLFAWCMVTTLTYFLSLYRGEAMTYRAVEMGWYGNGYLTVMLFAPFLNAGVDSSIEKGGANSAAKLLGVCLIFMFLMWLPLPDLGIKLGWGWHGHSTILLMIMYITGRVCSKIESLKAISIWRLCVIFCFSEFLTLGWAALTRRYDCGWFGQIKLWDNQSPAQVIAAVSVFLLFAKCKFPIWLGKTCMYAAPSMFVIYLLHDASCSAPIVRPLIQQVEIRANSLGTGYLGAIITAAVVVYVSGLAVDVLFRRKLLNAIVRFARQKIKARGEFDKD